MTRSILNSCLIDRKKFSISRNFNKFSTDSRANSINSQFLFDWLKGILDQLKLVKLNFPEFSPSSLQQFFMNKLPSYEHSRLSLRSKMNSINAIALKFNLTYLISNLNNINISFYKTVISTSMQKIDCRIF